MQDQEQEPKRFRIATGDTVHSHHATRASAKIAKETYLGGAAGADARIECTTDPPNATVIRWLPDDTDQGQS